MCILVMLVLKLSVNFKKIVNYDFFLSNILSYIHFTQVTIDHSEYRGFHTSGHFI